MVDALLPNQQAVKEDKGCEEHQIVENRQVVPPPERQGQLLLNREQLNFIQCYSMLIAHIVETLPKQSQAITQNNDKN